MGRRSFIGAGAIAALAVAGAVGATTAGAAPPPRTGSDVAAACERLDGRAATARCLARAEASKVRASVPGRIRALPARRARALPRFLTDVGRSPQVVLAGRRGSGEVRPPAAPVPAVAGTAITDRVAVAPVLECVEPHRDGFVAWFGTNNTGKEAVKLPVGKQNVFTPAPADRGQPTIIPPGRSVRSFSVKAPPGNLVWRLGSRTSTANETSKPCPAPPAPPALIDAVAVHPMDATDGGPEYMALRAMGVPVVIATTLEEALRYRVTVFAGTLSSAVIGEGDDGKEGAAQVKAYLSRGGVVVGEAVTAPVARPLFGIDRVVESAAREEIRFEGDDPTLADLDRKEERVVALDDAAQETKVGTVGYVTGDATSVLARFDDGTAALTRREHEGGGVAYAVGARFLDLITRHQEGARFSSKRRYVNSFETAADVWQLWLRGVYRSNVDGGVTIATAPEGAPYAVVPTLSLNFSQGAGFTPEYVKAAARLKAPTTVFADTHYVDDWLDRAWFATDEFDAAAKAVAANDGELASHSVAHSPVFNRLAMGTGAERYPDYRPFVASRTRTTGASIMGELRVSRELLQGYQRSVHSFRSGYLLVPRGLPQAQDAAGYRFDSSSTQGWVAGAFPFQVPRLDGRGYADVTTFPVVFEDAARGDLEGRIARAAELLRRNGDNGAPSVLLYYPRDTKALPDALPSWRGVLTLPREDGAWVGTLADFGEFWRDRQRVALVTSPSALCPGGRRIEVSNLTGTAIGGLSLDLPESSGLAVLRAGEYAAKRNAHGKVVLPRVPARGVVAGDLCAG